MTGKSVFSGDLEKTSPIDIVDRISNTISITMFVGRDDSVAIPELSLEYESALLDANKNATLNIIDGGHEIFLKPEVLDSVQEVISGYNEALQPTSHTEGVPSRSGPQT